MQHVNTIGLLLVLGSLVLCSCCGGVPRQVWSGEEARTEIRRTLGIELPDRVTDCHFRKEGLMVLLTYLKCRVPSDQTAAFLASSDLFPRELDEPGAGGELSSYNLDSTWWKPHELQQARHGRTTGERGKRLTTSHLALGQEGSSATVYFLYIED